MFCQNCAAELEPNAETCRACGARTTAARDSAEKLSETMKTASRDAWAAFKVFAVNPVGGLPAAFTSLGEDRARGVGLAFAAAFALCVVFGTYMILPSWSKPDAKGIFGLLILGIVPPVGIAAVSALARKAFQAAGSLAGDIFLAGASLVPSGFVVLLSGILSLGNFEIIAILGAFAGCYTILILYAGCTQISKIPDAKAAATIPVMLLLSAWLCKVVFAAML